MVSFNMVSENQIIGNQIMIEFRSQCRHDFRNFSSVCGQICKTMSKGVYGGKCSFHLLKVDEKYINKFEDGNEKYIILGREVLPC